MRSHDFQPGRLVAGLSLMAAAVLFFGDARGAWETPWYVLVPVVCGGLGVAAVLGVSVYAVRRHRGQW
ncbi:hypothetical protein [Streptomyces sp. NPDC006879]|uniref:hypothetical protein n=1 Tax=Streptomyces sp. NPDC006879 TaxID=3364767 RepID=UPI00369AB3E7